MRLEACGGAVAVEADQPPIENVHAVGHAGNMAAAARRAKRPSAPD